MRQIMLQEEAMSAQIALEEYELALKKGQKEYRELVMAGKSP